MKNLFLILSAIFLGACSVPVAKNITYNYDSTPVDFAEDFFVEEIEQCRFNSVNKTNLETVDSLLYVDPQRLYNSNSLTIDNDYIEEKIEVLLGMAYTAASNKDIQGSKKIINFIVEASEQQLFYDWENWQDIKNKPCWKSADAPCAYHHPEFVTGFFTNIMMSAIVLEEYMSIEQRKTIDRYFNKMYLRFVKPQAYKNDTNGFYAYANGGIGNLAYARWTRDQNLFNEEIALRKQLIKRHFTKAGWIENNSWRGNRDYWYHTLGVDVVLSYALIAKTNGIDLFTDPVIGPRLRSAVDKTVLGNQNLKQFSSKGYKGKNHIVGTKDANPHFHQMAKNAIIIMENEYNIYVTPRKQYFEKGGGNKTVSLLAGFNASCYYN